MKKKLLLGTLTVVALGLTACGSTPSGHQKTSSASSSTKQAQTSSSQTSKVTSTSSASSSSQQQTYTDTEYALMAYEKLDGQGMANLQSNADRMNWYQKGNKFSVDFGGHSTIMTVNNNDVLVTYDSPTSNGMGQKNASVNYTKAELAKEYGQYKDTLDQLIATGTTHAQQNGGASSTSSASSDSASVSQEALNKTYTIMGHTFKPVWADDYKSYVLVGTDGEGEAAEWAPNAIGYSVEERKQGMEQVSEAYKELYGKD
ncbi:hypothetical protein HC014_02535 [Limosilactobacillus fermentum]